MTQVLYDLFPAILTLLPADHPLPLHELTSAPPSKGSYQVATGRVIVTPDRIIVAKDSPDGPVPVFSEEIAPGGFEKSATRGEDSYVTTITGKKIAFKKDEACGCGSRLRSWNPYNILSSKNDPTE